MEPKGPKRATVGLPPLRPGMTARGVGWFVMEEGGRFVLSWLRAGHGGGEDHQELRPEDAAALASGDASFHEILKRYDRY